MSDTPRPALQHVIDDIICDMTELPDRTSPDDWPEAMLITIEEMRSILEHHLAESRPSAPPPPTYTDLGEPTAQMILDSGLNVFAFKLVSESLRGKKDIKTFSPFSFTFMGVRYSFAPEGTPAPALARESPALHDLETTLTELMSEIDQFKADEAFLESCRRTLADPNGNLSKSSQRRLLEILDV